MYYIHVGSVYFAILWIDKFLVVCYNRDDETMPFKLLSKEEFIKQITESMKKSDMGATTPANEVSQRMRGKRKYNVHVSRITRL